MTPDFEQAGKNLHDVVEDMPSELVAEINRGPHRAWLDRLVTASEEMVVAREGERE